VRVAVVAHVAQAAGVAEGDVELGALGLSAWPCPPAAEVSVESRPGDRFIGHAELRIRGQLGGQPCADVRVRAEVAVWRPTPVAARAVAAGEVVPLVPGRARARDLLGEPVDPDRGPFEAIAPLRAGEPVTVPRVRAVPLRRQGEVVDVVAAVAGVQVRAKGRLLEDGAAGATVRVAVSSTGSVVEGVLQPDGTVLARGVR
jgi:flagella basal body P-ring formation protein FlgA